MAFGATNVSDLSPLKGMPLEEVKCGSSKVSDLSALQEMKKLRQCVCNDTQVADLSPLRGKPLTFLNVQHTIVADLSVLKDMPLKDLSCDFKPERDTKILRSIKTVERINGKPAAEFWKEVEEQQKGKKP
jgi:Leucine-rich repeat (LRR) protein